MYNGVTKLKLKSKSKYSYIQYIKCKISSSTNYRITHECHYKTLGIVRNASDKDIRNAYIQMAKKYHPDVNTSNDSTQKFTSINEAYSILSDKTKKQKYDSEIGNNHSRYHPNSANNNNNANNSNNKNWWDFNFYGTNNNTNSNKANSDSNRSSFDEFEFSRDFYGDFSRFSTNTNNRKRKRNNYENNNDNPYADYYYYYQQVNNVNNNSNHNHENGKYENGKYQNIWSEFEFDFDVEQEFDSEFNNEAFWRFLRNNNKKHRIKHKENVNVNHKKGKIKFKHHYKDYKDKDSEKDKNNTHNKDKDGEKDKNKEHKDKNKGQKAEINTESSENKKNKKFKKTEITMNDIEINLDLDFLEAVNGCSKNINFKRNEICGHCGGLSFEPSIESKKCIKCDGKGSISGFGNDFVKHKCVNCNGRGIIFKNCSNCNGKSIISISKSLTITIPSGIRENDRVRVSKQGHQYLISNNNKYGYGHIWINCCIKKHEYFIRINNDIHITMNIPYALAVLGGSFVCPTIYGPNILKILPGINSGDYECMESKGIYDSSTNKKGNQYIHFIINIPNENQLTSIQKELLNQYAKYETAPSPITSNNKLNIKDFKKYGERVQTFNQTQNVNNNTDNDNDDDVDTDTDVENDVDNNIDNIIDDQYYNECYDDDLEDLL